MEPIDGCLYVSVPDRPGALAEFLRSLAEKGINVTALRVISRRAKAAHVLFSVDRVDAALGLPGVRYAEDVADFSDVSRVE
jgi:prephenate dehydratase